jgi:Arc/MetJ-type ribon-helix-helix transcriptional regulator
MTVRLPPDIEALVALRVSSGEFSGPDEVVRAAMAPWIERELQRKDVMASIRTKIAEGDSDDNDFSPSEVRDHLDRVLKSLPGKDPNVP